jgi:hypothetical protein
VISLALIAAGYFGPWVAHRAAGLVLSADDLAEWVKFLPAVQAGQSGLVRELFYLPIWIVPIGLGLLAGRITSTVWKSLCLVLALILVFTPLPKYPELLTAYQTPEFAPSFWITVVALVVSMVLGSVGHSLSNRLEALVWIVLGVLAATLAPLHFVKVLPEVEKLYHFAVGWGVFATVGGGIGLIAIGAWMLLGKRRPAG